MIDPSWATRSATEQAEAIRTGELASRDLLELYLDRIADLDPVLNAVVTVAADRARSEADAADAAIAAGAPLGPLHGLPCTVKDAVETEGIRTTGGASELAGHVPTRDAPAVARLRAAGAIVFGKSNLPRWSGDAQTWNDLFGRTSNPWDVTRVPGGSSGGAAAAVAAGLTSFELGTDIGGSIRIPSHCCGTFGLKPSYGVVPQRGNLLSAGSAAVEADINVLGPIARHADDLELLLGVLVGPDPTLAPAWRIELPPPTAASLAGRRLAVWLEEPDVPSDPAMLAVLRGTIDRLADAGAEVEEVRPPVEPGRQFEVFAKLLTAATTLAHEEDRGGTHRDWLRAVEERAAIQATWAAWFEGHDALLAPVMCTTAFPHHDGGTVYSREVAVDGRAVPYVSLVWWTGVLGILGVPIGVPPVGRTADGLPVGMQVVTPFLRDRDAARITGLVADVAGGYEVPPLASHGERRHPVD